MISYAGGNRIRCYADSHEPGRVIYFNGVPDYNEMIFMARYLRPGDRFIDGGANIGLYTLLAASLVGPDGHVDAFEAAPKEVARLCDHISLNCLTNITVHVAAVGDRTDRLSFVIDRGAGNRIATSEDTQRPTVEVASAALDDIAVGHYAMAKLDIEGAEPLAFVGAQRLLEERSPPVWQIELVDTFTRRFGWPASRLVGWLAEREYDLAAYDVRANCLRFDDVGVSGGPNRLVVARSSRDAVLTRLRDGVDRVGRLGKIASVD